MKKLLVIALSVAMIFAFAAVSMAEATFSGEIDAGYKTYSNDATNETLSQPYLFGKIVMSGKLADSVTGIIVLKDSDDDITGTAATNKANASNNVSKMVFDEADFTLTVPFGNIKMGYFGWNNNLKDIIDPVRGDVKTDVVINPNFKITDNITFGVAYALPTSDDKGDTKADNSAYYGLDLAYATDTFGVDLIYTNSSSYYTKAGTDGNSGKGTDTGAPEASAAVAAGDRSAVAGINVWYLINGFKPYIQYEVVTDDAYYTADAVATTGNIAWTKKADDPSNIILGCVYDSADSAWYGRVEYDLSDANDQEHMTGVRVGYKLTSGAKIEGQYYANISGGKDSRDYVKVVCPF